MPRECEPPIESATAIRWRAFPGVDAAQFLAAFAQLRRAPLPWLLDSALRGAREGRYSFAGADPYLVLRAFGRDIEIDCRRGARPEFAIGLRSESGDPLEWIRALLPAPPTTDCPPLPFVGGAVGCLGYELAESVEALELHGRDDLGLPDLVLLFVDRLLGFDSETCCAYAIGLGFAPTPDEAERRAAEAQAAQAALFEAVLHAPRSAREKPTSDRARRARLLRTPRPEGLHCTFSRAEYHARVRALLGEIACGNVYEANLTERMTLACKTDPWHAYEALREANPAPFAAYLELPDGCVLGSSPERFLSLSSRGEVESRPIKGTRSRATSDAEDAQRAAELSNSIKDRAENLMIVDLVRNDLGRVCEIGSVRVPECMVVERHPSVFHLVSTVSGQLREDCDAVDLLRAAFPPGSMTGAPKIAAMRILDALEPVRRGFYSGALGYLDVRGGLDLSVVIRTILVRKGYAHLHAGGAIVADSDPDQEYQETFAKARALFAALSAGEGCESEEGKRGEEGESGERAGESEENERESDEQSERNGA